MDNIEITHNSKDRTVTFTIKIPPEEGCPLLENGRAYLIVPRQSKFVHIPDTGFLYKLILIHNLGTPQFANDLIEENNV